MSRRSGASSRLRRCMKAPLRLLCRARDLYVRSMTSCAGSIERGGIAAASLGYPQPFAPLPRSFSLQSGRSSSADEDLRELVRVASLARSRSLGLGTAPAAAVPPAVLRSQSVAVGRIDEDKPCDDFGDAKIGADLLLPRSRSCAAGAKKSPRMFL